MLMLPWLRYLILFLQLLSKMPRTVYTHLHDKLRAHLGLPPLHDEEDDDVIAENRNRIVINIDLRQRKVLGALLFPCNPFNLLIPKEY